MMVHRFISNRSEEAINYAATYGMFHWGPIAWAIYVFASTSNRYSLYVKEQPIIRISHACRPLIGKYTDKWPGKMIDVLFIFGLLGGAGTLGLATPMIAEGVGSLTGLDGSSTWLRLTILGISTLIFAASSYSGINYGIKSIKRH